VDDLRSPAGWLPVHRDQLRAQRSVSSMGSLYLFLPFRVNPENHVLDEVHIPMQFWGAEVTHYKI